MKNYFGYVYIWFDTKHRKFIIGSHHGKIEDRYTTSTGGIHVRNIFKSRPETMKFRVLQYNYDVDDRIYTLQLEQKWLDKRKNISKNSRYYNKTNFAGGGFDREIQLTRVKNKTHHFLGGKIQRDSNNRRVKNGTHNFQQTTHKQHISTIAKERVQKGDHHFCTSEFNKKPFTIMCSDGRYWYFKSKVDAIQTGIKPGVIDKVKKYKTFMIKRYSKGLISFKAGDVLSIIEEFHKESQ